MKIHSLGKTNVRIKVKNFYSFEKMACNFCDTLVGAVCNNKNTRLELQQRKMNL